MTEPEYLLKVRPLTPAERGGFLVEYPDLPGCMSDGGTVDEAVPHGREARDAWIAAMREAGRPVPASSGNGTSSFSWKWQMRTLRSLHRSLNERARREGVSLNTVAVALLAEGLGQHEAR